jgi:menaquinone-dependent protoporphyrinogen oxidase
LDDEERIDAMSDRILVTYASQGGSTAGVAEAIGRTLATDGDRVDVLPVSQVDDLRPYRAAVIGSAVHSGKWMPEAASFVERNQAGLRRMPTAVFQVCMMLATGSEQYRRMAPEWLAPLREQIHPAAEGSFAGALWPNRYPKLSEKLGLGIFLAVIKVKAGDYRDWDAVQEWAESLRPVLCR